MRKALLALRLVAVDPTLSPDSDCASADHLDAEHRGRYRARAIPQPGGSPCELLLHVAPEGTST
jgi:hypothetical protein